jgi:hypothetical protein
MLARPMIDTLLKNANLIAHSISNGPTFLLQGLYAAEGSVDLRKSGSLREIKFTSLRAEDRLLVINLLLEKEILSHENATRGEVRIFGYENFKRMREVDIFKFHSRRRNKMNLGINSFQKVYPCKVLESR